MKRSRYGLVVVLLVLTSCAFGDGNPWGIGDVALDVAFTPDDGRLTTDGWLKTSADYEIDIASMRIEIDAVGVVVDTSGGGPVTFDPANPPAGYSLCHNGHCHAADGRLVDYADIEQELAGGAGAASFVLRRPGGEVTIDGSTATVALGECSSPDCWLEQGSARSVLVEVHRLDVDVTVRDAQRPPRLAAETSLSVSVEREMSIDTTIDEPLDGTEPVGLRVRSRLVVPDQLFDRIDFATAGTSTVTDQIASNFSEHGTLETNVTRYDP